MEESAAALTVEDVRFIVNNIWMLIATAMVFVMHLGFACLESGLTQAKNSVAILFKNVAIVAIGLLSYAVIGWSLMYGSGVFAEGSALAGWLAWGGVWITPPEGGMTPAYNEGYTFWTDFIFQAMFAATAATIVSGAVAERIRVGPFLVFCTLYVSLIYPIVGFWKWGGGWLEEAGFHDFAGSTIVHSVGGWGALAGVMVLGPRFGRFVNGRIRPIMGHSLPLATVGMFLLWFGWFGFNGGSVLSANPSGDFGTADADPYGFAGVSLVFVTTSLAAAAGIVTAMATSWIAQAKPDLSMLLNGALAGLVGVTAGADVVTPLSAVIIGGVAGVIVVLSVLGIDRLRLDDPVGAISVHLVCGIWGTLAVGVFSSVPDHNLLAQAKGVVATGLLCFPAAFVFFFGIRATMGLRVPESTEIRGLDVREHGMEAYSGFQFFSTQ